MFPNAAGYHDYEDVPRDTGDDTATSSCELVEDWEPLKIEQREWATKIIFGGLITIIIILLLI